AWTTETPRPRHAPKGSFVRRAAASTGCRRTELLPGRENFGVRRPAERGASHRPGAREKGEPFMARPFLRATSGPRADRTRAASAQVNSDSSKQLSSPDCTVFALAIALGKMCAM